MTGRRCSVISEDLSLQQRKPHRKQCNCLLAARIRHPRLGYLVPVTIRMTGSREGVTGGILHQENVHRKVLGEQSGLSANNYKE